MDIIISECFHLRILKYQNATRGVLVTFVFFLVIDKADKAPLNAVLNDQEHSGIVFLHSVYFFAFVIVIVFVFIICVCIFWLQAQLAPFAALSSPGNITSSGWNQFDGWVAKSFPFTNWFSSTRDTIIALTTWRAFFLTVIDLCIVLDSNVPSHCLSIF